METTISEREKRQIVKSWLLETQTLVARGLISSPHVNAFEMGKAITALLDKVSAEDALEPNIEDVRGNMVGRRVCVYDCSSREHGPNNGTCIHHLVGQKVIITKEIGCGLYNIEGVARPVSLSEVRLWDGESVDPPKGRGMPRLSDAQVIAAWEAGTAEAKVGETVLVKRCASIGGHGQDDKQCVCHFTNQTVKLGAWHRLSGLYEIEGSDKLISETEFELLRNQPVEGSLEGVIL